MECHIHSMDMSSVYKALRLFASVCFVLLSCGLPTTLSAPTTIDPLYSPSDESFSIMEENEAAISHGQLAAHVTALRSLFNNVFHAYKVSRFNSLETSCVKTFKIPGLPPHHRLTDLIELEERESDLLMTHRSFLSRYMTVMESVIVDEYRYEGEDSFVNDREQSFQAVVNHLERVQVLVNQQLAIEELQNDGIILFSMDDFRFPPEDNESFRNIRILCALEDIHLYLPTLSQHATFLKNFDH